MKIYDVTKIYGAYEAQPAAGKPARRAASVSRPDQLSLSRDAMDFQAVMRALKDVPDTRADRVSELSAKYETGEYRTDTADIAEALFKSGHFRKI